MKVKDSICQSDSSFVARESREEISLPAAKRRLEVLLVADDLTGAGDSGLGFVQEGFSASVLLDSGRVFHGPTTEVQAVVTGTRALEGSQVRQRLESIFFLPAFSGPVVFHKVDSAGRGNPGVEIAVLMDVLSCDAVVYAPAFPAAGRVVRGGRLRVSDFSGQSTEINLEEMFPAALRNRVQLLAAGATESLRESMAAARSERRNIWVCDAESAEDLKRIVEAASRLSLRILWSGSAGLAGAVARHLAAGRATAQGARKLPARRGAALVICGTDHPVTVEQTRRLAGESTELSLEDAVPSFGVGVLRLDWTRATAEAVRCFWQRLPGPVAGLVLTGGDTAAFVLEALGAEALEIGGAVETGIPWGVIRGGVADGVVAITKSGGFGHEESLVHLATACRRTER